MELQQGQLTDPQLQELIAGDPELRTATIAQVAKAFGVSERSVRQYIYDGRLRATRFGRHVRITIQAVKDFLRGERALQRTTNPC